MPDRRAQGVFLVSAAAAVLALASCETPEEMRGAKSLIQVAQPVTPEQAARMATSYTRLMPLPRSDASACWAFSGL
ncbi:MAG TPA: hypothetical protein PLK37_10350, partial [Terricaulis sp.]|nr:hypothetical protein [Terricaulis sp.]